MTSPTTTEPKLAEPFAERVERLARELRRAIRFDRPAILLAVYRSEFVRAEAEAALRDRLHKMGQRAIPVRVTSPDDADLPARLRDWPDQGDAVFFVNGLQWGAPTIYSALNVRREYFVNGRLRAVFWLTEAEAVALTTQAPDFWVFRHRVVEFVEPPQVGKAVPLARELAWRGFGDRTLRQDTAAKIALREALLADLPEGEVTEGARAELLYTLGGLYWAGRQYERAIEVCQQALALAQQLGDQRLEAWVHNGLGNVYSDLGRHEEAIAEYRRALELDPNDAAPHNGLGNVYRDLGRHDEAIAEYRRAVELDPTDADYHSNLGLVYRDLGRHDEAIAAYRRAIKLDPTDADYHNNLGSVYRDLGRHDEAIAECRRALELDPNLAMAHNNLGVVYRALGRHDEAIAEYRRAVELDPTNTYPHNGLGLVYRDLGRHDEAMAAYQRAVELDPTFAYSHTMLGALYETLGQFDDALREYRQAAELEPENATRHVSLASLYLRLRQTDAWAHHVAEARRLVKPDDTYNLACLESVAGNVDAALEHLAQALAARPGLRAWAARDPDLAWIRDDPRFQALVGGQGE